MKFYIQILFFFFIGIDLCVACLNNDNSGNLLCAGYYELDSSNRLVLLGTDSRENARSTDLNFSSLGFKGNGMDHLDPKFLLAVNSEGVKWIYSFEIPRPITEDKSLPPRLLDNSHVKSRAIARFTIDNIVKFGGKTARFIGVPFVGLPVVGAYLVRKQRQNIRDREGAELLEWIHLALPPYNLFPEFKQALSSNPVRADYFLKKMGADLIVRYHPKSKFRGLFVPNENKASFYSNFRDNLSSKRAHSMNQFFSKMNQKGLVIELLGSEMAMVFIDTCTPHLPEEYAQTISKHMGETFLNGKVKSSCFSGSQNLVPYLLVSFVNTRGPVDLMYFMNPKKSLSRVLKKNYLKLVKEIGFSALPGGPFVGIPATVVDLGLKLAVKKGAFPQLLKRVESYGALRGMTETRAIDFSTLRGINFEPLEKSLKYFKIPDAEIEKLRIKMGTTEQSAAMNEILFILATENEIRGRLIVADFDKQENISESENARFKAYLSKKLGDYLGNSTRNHMKNDKELKFASLDGLLGNNTKMRAMNKKLTENHPGVVDLSTSTIDIDEYFCHP